MASQLSLSSQVTLQCGKLKFKTLVTTKSKKRSWQETLSESKRGQLNQQTLSPEGECDKKNHFSNVLELT